MKTMIKGALVKVQSFLRDERGSAQKSLRLPVVGFVLLLTAGVLFLTPQEAWACVIYPECSYQALDKCCTHETRGGIVKTRYARVFCPDGSGGYHVWEVCHPYCINGGSC